MSTPTTGAPRVPDKPTLDNLEERWASAWEDAGTYRFDDVFDNPEIDGTMPISVEITIEGEEMRLHFDSPPQVRAGINMTYTALLATTYYMVKSVVDPTILPNAGLARPLVVTASEGTTLYLWIRSR